MDGSDIILKPLRDVSVREQNGIHFSTKELWCEFNRLHSLIIKLSPYFLVCAAKSLIERASAKSEFASTVCIDGKTGFDRSHHRKDLCQMDSDIHGVQ